MVVRADAGPEVGGGHVMRTLALAAVLVSKNWKVRYAMRFGAETVETKLRAENIDLIRLPQHAATDAAGFKAMFPGGADLILLDHYGIDIEFERNLAGWSGMLAAIDDGPGRRRHDVDLLIDFSPGITESAWRKFVVAKATILAGTRYALIRPEIICQRKGRAAPSHANNDVRRVFISFGASDSRNATELALRCTRQALPNSEIDIFMGLGSVHADRIAELSKKCGARLHLDSPEYPKVLGSTDLAIGAGGVSALERAYLGIPSIVVTTAENQRHSVEALSAAGAVISAGDISTVNEKALASQIKTLAGDPALRAVMSTAGTALIDGNGTNRVVDHIIDLARKSKVAS